MRRTAFCSLLLFAAVALFGLIIVPEVLDVYRGFSVSISGRRIHFRRRAHGVVDIFGRDEIDFARGLGYLHAKDRGVQLYLMKLIAEGRLTECIKYDENFLKIDMGIRNLQFARNAKATVPKLSKEMRAYVEAYADGINKYFETHRRPLEFWLVGYEPEPWKISDTIAIYQLNTYVGLAEMQSDSEKFILQLIQRSDAGAKLMKRLFTPHLNALDDEVISLLKKVRIERPYFPPELKAVVPSMAASNAWAVSAEKSASGAAFLAGDPHLPIDRLPPVWYEVVMHLPNDYRMGITIPGVPGLVMGRNSNVSYAFTYGCMDLIDYWMEECDEEKCRLDGQPMPYTDLTVIHEQLRLKKKLNPSGGPYEVMDLYIYQTPSGAIIERVNATRKGLERGIYLSRKLASTQVLQNVEAIANLPTTQSVDEAIKQLSIPLPLSGNFIVADSKGNIAYRQIGALPIRQNTGLIPLPGWNPQLQWIDIYSARMLAEAVNPPENFLASANDDVNAPHRPLSVTVYIGEYRITRLKQLLSQKKNFTMEDMKAFQSDLFSAQAEQFMQLLRPILAKKPEGLNPVIANALSAWDLRYNKESIGAVLFEEFYRALIKDIYEPIFGEQYWAKVEIEDARNNFAFFFDRIFLQHMQKDDELLWHGESQSARLKRVLLKTFANRTETTAVELPTYGSTRKIRMWNMFFSGNLPSFLGFDPEVILEGSAATLRMGRLAPASPKGRSAKGVSFRMLSDMGKHEIETALPGGASGSRFSYWYTTDILRWINDQYKTLGVFA